MTDFKIIQGNCIDLLKTLPAESVQTCVTSPPYFGLRDYGLSPWTGGDPECPHTPQAWAAVAGNVGPAALRANETRVLKRNKGECRACGAVKIAPHVWGGDAGCDHEFDSQTKRSGGAYKPGSKKRWQHSADDFQRDDRFLDGHPHIPAGELCAKCGAWCGDLGLEPTPWLYVRHMVDVFEEIRRVLRPDGTLWLNLGDSYAGSWGNYGGQNRGNGTQRSISKGSQITSQEKRNGNFRPPQATGTGLKSKDLMGMPWRVAFALQEAGWWLRQDIIWHKLNPMPESVADRCTKAHEYVFMLTKSPRYFYDSEAIKEAATEAAAGNSVKRWGVNETTERADGEGVIESQRGIPWKGSTRNKRSVWSIATQPYSEAHFATFPPKLIEPCVLAGTSERGGCASCGTSWERVLKRQVYTADKMPDGWDTGPGHHEAFHRNGREKGEQPARDRTVGNRNGEGDSTLDDEIPTTETLGWKPGCECYGLDVIREYPACPPPKKRTPEKMAAYQQLVAFWNADWDRLKPLYDKCEVRPQIVLDPFSGSGTTLMVATQHKRASIGCELNQEYIEIAMRRLKDIQMELF